MKLSIVIPVMNQHELFKAVYEQLRKVTDTMSSEVEFIIIDNGSEVPLNELDVLGSTWIIRNNKTIGVYPTFKQGFEKASGDVVAFLHSDVVIWEGMWNDRVMDQFKLDQNLGMIGFIGSNEIDSSGGRGLGTTSNFQGLTLSNKERHWQGSAARIHGKESGGFSKAAVVDGCVMIIRRTVWEAIGYRDNFPPHHFYDRLISTQMLEKGWNIGVLGVAFDHFSGQTVNQEKAYHDFARQWCLDRGIISPEGNYDLAFYREAEKMWLKEYRDEKRLVPIRV